MNVDTYYPSPPPEPLTKEKFLLLRSIKQSKSGGSAHVLNIVKDINKRLINNCMKESIVVYQSYIPIPERDLEYIKKLYPDWNTEYKTDRRKREYSIYTLTMTLKDE